MANHRNHHLYGENYPELVPQCLLIAASLVYWKMLPYSILWVDEMGKTLNRKKERTCNVLQCQKLHELPASVGGLH
jgi:hypothetical protein